MLKKILFFIAVLTAGPAWATEVPKLLGHVNDYAHTLNPSVVTEINSKLDTAETSLPTNPQIVVYTLPRLPDEKLDTFADTVYSTWFTDTKTANGVLILYAPGSRRLHIKVGDNLKSIFTDDELSKIMNSARSYVRASSGTMVVKILTDNVIDHLQSIPVAANEVAIPMKTESAPVEPESNRRAEPNAPAQISPEFKVSQTDLEEETTGSKGISPFIVIPVTVLMFFGCLVGFVIYSDWAKSRAYKKEYDEFVAKHAPKRIRTKTKPSTKSSSKVEIKTVTPTKRSPPAKKKRKATIKKTAKEPNNPTENN